MSYTINNISRSTFARGLEKHLQDPLFNFGAFRVNFLRQILSEPHTMSNRGFIKKIVIIYHQSISITGW